MSANGHKTPNPVPGNDIMKTIGARLKAIRKDRGYSNSEKFAHKFEFDRTQYSRYERGENINMKTFLRILAALDITLSEFFNEGFD